MRVEEVRAALGKPVAEAYIYSFALDQTIRLPI